MEGASVMSYRTTWIYYCVAAVVAICLYVVGKMFHIDFTNEMWTTVCCMVVCANIYAIKMKDEENKH